MRSDIPYGRLVPGILGTVFAIVMFLVLNASFGGPGAPQKRGYELTMTFSDSQNLLKKSLVMIRGVRVGEVKDVQIRRGQARVRITVERKYGPIRLGTRAQVGHRTIFGEPIVVLHPGRTGALALADGARLRTDPTVEPDEALQVFGPRTRKQIGVIAQELARGYASPKATDRLSATITGFDDSIARVRDLTVALRGQQTQIAQLVTNGATALNVLAGHDAQLRQLVGSGRVVADTLAARPRAIGDSITVLDGLTDDATRALTAARPLFAAADPVAVRLTGTARTLSPALAAVAPLARDARILTEALPGAGRATTPLLEQAATLLRVFRPLAARAVPATANTVPFMQYLAEQAPDLAGFAANGSDTVSRGDADGAWIHAFILADPALLLGKEGPCAPQLGGLCVNPYPKGGSGADLQPYAKGDLVRRLPYTPAK